NVLKKRNLNFKLRSGYNDSRNLDVLILDTFGELPRIYGISDVVYIGNSIIPINERGAGHNIIEPLAHGKPIIFGKFMNFWQDIIKEIKNICPQCEVNNTEELAEGIHRLTTDKDLVQRLGSLGRRISLEDADAVDKYIEFVKDNLYNLS
ncbi:MAG: hypothetical protein KAU58_00750, partial [Candidatus Omnitrophica bacterium]|nr:hypothetical protein [Candidatus Omnitrophota bacterium]